MTTREVVLDGGSPWGFRLHGGADLNQPLRISRVNPGSKAALRGIREGDFITSINNQSTKDITNAEAHALLRNSGDTLKLGLNEDINGSPKRRQYKTVHQETHSETVKKSSITSYTVTSSKTVETSNEQQTTKINGNNVNGDPVESSKHPVASQRSTLSSNCSSSSSTSTYTSITSPSGTDMADNGRSRRRRGRNNRKRAKQNVTAPEVIIEETDVAENAEKKDYRVESPKTVKPSNEKKPVKSRSLDDDDLIKIQELSEVSESEDKSECKAVVSEAESDVEWEVTSSIQEPEIQTGTLSLSLPLEQYTTEEVSLMSPEEELTLRNFLESLNLITSPDDAFRQVREISTMETVKSRRARKRAALEQYFTPIIQNPRFLDVINEESSDLSDREQPATHHLKQGTPEPEVPPKTRKIIDNPTFLVGTKIIEVPTVMHVPESIAEVVYLEDSSNSTTPDPKSEEEEKDNLDDILSSANSSVPDLRESEVVEEKKEIKVTVKKNDILVTCSENIEILKDEGVKEIVGDLTPPPTPKEEGNLIEESKDSVETLKEGEDKVDERSMDKQLLDFASQKLQTEETTKVANEESQAQCKNTELAIEKVETAETERTSQDEIFTSETTIELKKETKSNKEILPQSDVPKEKIIRVEVEKDSKSVQTDSFGLKNPLESSEFVKEKLIPKQNESLPSKGTSAEPEIAKERIINIEIEKEGKGTQIPIVDFNSNEFKKIESFDRQCVLTNIENQEESTKLLSFANTSGPEAAKERIIHVEVENGDKSMKSSKESIQKAEMQKEFKSIEDQSLTSGDSLEKLQSTHEKIIPIKIEKFAQNTYPEDILTKSETVKEKTTNVEIHEEQKSVESFSYKNFATKSNERKPEAEKPPLSLHSVCEDSSNKLESNKEKIIPIKIEHQKKFSEVDSSKESPKKSQPPKERIINIEIEKEEKSTEGAKATNLPTKVEKLKNEIQKEQFLHSAVEDAFRKTESTKEKIIPIEIRDESIKPDTSKERIIKIEKETEQSTSHSSIKDSKNLGSIKNRIIHIEIKNNEKSVEDLTSQKKEKTTTKEIKKEDKFDQNSNLQTPETTKQRIINIEVEKRDSQNKNPDHGSTPKKSNPLEERIIQIEIEKDNKNTPKMDTEKINQPPNLPFRNTPMTSGPAKEKIINVELEKESTFAQADKISNILDDSFINSSKERIVEVRRESASTSAQKKAQLDTTTKDYFAKTTEISTSSKETPKERIIHVEIEKPPTSEDSTKNVKIIQTLSCKASPEIMKLDDLTPPIVMVPIRSDSLSKNFLNFEKKGKGTDLSSKKYQTFEESESKKHQDNNLRKPEELTKEKSSTVPVEPKESKISKTKTIESPSKEIESLNLRLPENSIVYSNVLSPPAPSPSPSLSSGSSSRATSLCTAKYNLSGSVGDITSIKDEEQRKTPKLESPLTLRELCVNFLMNQPFGTDMLQELADVSSSIEKLTLGTVPEDEKDSWSREKRQELVDLHSKFIYRTTYHDAVERQVKNEVDIGAIRPEMSNRLLAIIRDAEEPQIRKFSTVPRNMESARLKARDLSEWLKLARDKSDENNQNVGNAQRRKSDDLIEQMRYLQEKEKEIEEELELLEEEKRRLEMPRKIRLEDYHISKRGDFAENRKSRPLSMPVSTEFFRQQMYEEYMDKIAAREERKQQKVIKISQVDSTPNTMKASQGIEDEFMDKVKEKQKLGKLESCEKTEDESEEKLPKHLQEFLDIASDTSCGVWSPGQKQESQEQQKRESIEAKNEPISPVWTPKSATTSPTVERKEFRPVKFESPVLSRKNEDSGEEPPWKVPETSSDTGIVLSSTLEKRLPTSLSSPASGFNDFTTPRLPRAQNPTITLLQKAREGQLPKGALYIEQDNYKRVKNEKPPMLGPGEILYKIKNEYTSESDSEKPRKMADLGPRQYEGIGPTTKDGMPLILRSEVKDANQSKWYKKMYDTIHKQRPHRDEYVTVRYKQRRGQYPYTSGYLSEPEPGAYDSDFTDYKYATLDRRRTGRDKENDHLSSSTMPRTAPERVGSTVVRHGHDPYKNQPGRIENYIPGHSSISEKEAKEWWDEVMDIFDGWLDDNSALPSYDYMFSRALAKSHLEQQKRVPQTKSFINQALKESGYESDSTLVFRRRDDTAQQLSPLEQKEAYKTIQKGGDIPLYGLRKPAPERPKEEPELEYFPISPTLTRIRIHKTVKPQREILCYPVTVHPNPTVFAHYKRTAPSASTPKPPPSPPRRRSSRNNSTLRLISTMKVKTEKSPICKRHETCFTTTSNIDNTNVKYLRDKITCKLSPAKGKETKPRLKVSKVVSASPELRSRIISTLSTTKDGKNSTSKVQSRTNVVGTSRNTSCCRSSSAGSIRKPCKKCLAKAEAIKTPVTKTFGTEKRKVDLVLPKLRRTTLVSSPDLLSPTEVKKAVESQKHLPSGTVFKKSTALLASAKNGQNSHLKDVVLPIKVGVSEKGKSLLKTSIHKPASPVSVPKLRTKSLSPVPPSEKQGKHKISLESLKSPKKVVVSTVGKSVPLTKTSKSIKPKTLSSTDVKKMKKSKKEEINGEIAKKTKDLIPIKCAGRAAGTEIAKKLQEMRETDFGSTDTLTDIQRQKEAIQTDYFFQHLFLRDLPSPTSSSRNTWLLEKTYQLQKRKSSTSEPTVSAMKVYLSHTRPVTDSKFRSLDLARSRSASPKSVTWEERSVIEKRSSSLPPKLIFSQTSRPVSPKVERTPPPSPRSVRSPSSRRIMQLKNHPERISESRESLAKNELAIYSCPSISHSTSSIDSCDRKEYQNYVKELLRSSSRSSRFKDLNEFYSAIEKFGQLEQTTSSYHLKPRRRDEDEIIDYDRWREVRTRERAEKELKSLINQLKENAKEKGFLFSPKEVDNYRWKKEFDRGLRIKEKSVDNIKEEFEKLKEEKKKDIIFNKDTYKPLWRGDSVLSLANKMVERRSQSEGRISQKQKLIESERMLTHGIGSRLWSSLSSEQVNILKNQLSEIYSQNLKKKEDFTIQVPKEKIFYSPLTVRRNSDTSEYSLKNQEKSLTENEKKTLSHNISKEVIDHVTKRHEALPLVLAKETRGAIAAAMSKSEQSEKNEKPCQALIKTDETTPKLPSASETESGSTDESTKTVINVKDEIKKKVEYFETVAEKEKFSPIIYKPADSPEGVKSPEMKRRSLSQSYQNLKELFGEKELMKFATVPLSATRKEVYISPERPQVMRIPSPPISETTSNDSFYRSRSLSPYSDESLALVKSGEVRRLKNKFEESYPKLHLPRRSRSDSSLYRYGQIYIPEHNVELLRSKYEYPAHAGRGRSRFRRGGVVSPTFLRAEDRFMPHINIISKIASLYAKKQTPEEKSQSMEELAKILGCPIGEVEKLRQKFDAYSQNISLLGHMFTSSPNIKELRDIAPYLAASWIAHRYPRSEDNTRSLSSPESSIASRDTTHLRRDRHRPKSSSPTPKQSSILKNEKKIDAKNQPISRYQPEPLRYKSWWSPTYTRPSVSFKEPEPPAPPPKGHHGVRNLQQESPRKYVENEVTIHYKTPVRQEIKEYLSEDELAYRQAEAMKKIYQEERRRKYLQVSKSLQELQDMNNRRHTDNFIPSQKSPIPLNRYDDFDDLAPPVKPRPRSPEPRLMARALYNFVGQTARELTFRKGDIIYVRRQVDKNWYEGELNAMVGLFPVNYVEIITYDTTKPIPRKSHEGQARAKYNFVAQTHLELSLAKGELVIITRRVDDNWFEGKIGGRKGIFPVSYVEILIDPTEPPTPNNKPVAAPAAHSLLLNGSAGGKESMGSHSYTPNLSTNQLTSSSSYHAKPVQITGNYGSLKGAKNPINQALHIETQAEPIPYRALYKYLPQNDDELELLEGDTVYVLEKCDDGWYVGSSERTGAFGTFPGNYVEKI